MKSRRPPHLFSSLAASDSHSDDLDGSISNTVGYYSKSQSQSQSRRGFLSTLGKTKAMSSLSSQTDVSWLYGYGEED